MLFDCRLPAYPFYVTNTVRTLMLYFNCVTIRSVLEIYLALSKDSYISVILDELKSTTLTREKLFPELMTR